MGSYRWLNRWSGDLFKTNRPDEGILASPVNRLSRTAPPTSFVFLLRESRTLDAAMLAQAATEAFGVEISVSKEDGVPASVVGESPYFLVRVGEFVLAVHNVPGSYFDNSAAVVAEVADLRLRQAVARHSAWLSVDLLHGPRERERLQYSRIAPLAAALFGEDCLAICVPARHRLHLCDRELPGKLSANDPLRALESSRLSPVLGVREDDPRMRAAVREARRRWPEFVQAFEERQTGQMFSVKVPLREGSITEYMWVSVSALENNQIYGRLDNEPFEMRRLHAGDRVRIPVRELNDWMFTHEETLEGGFTIDVLARRPRGPQ